ncbi:MULTISPECIES: alpha/beta fold hydrolase [unclassified Amycolatopsis]|uniref:alpha/beta fold hydrolase n=1 Tax=unclassified Amycolatopsis TaxID=2618356 RepID=UPI001FF4E35D|nr:MULTISPECIES: alpha/beta hydrolase [unclassified Amycolatopsis]UOZ09711.1 alpha/beta hydrolase [Amycolatopsis sp. WQ 127309]WSJ76009.1 alpha/beta hydrolase [Amycolatopsis sp. NBC_01307]
MTPSRRLLAIAGGVGAVATGTAAAAIAVAAQQRRHSEDPYVDEPLGELKPDRTSTVAADDGTPLSVEEIDPEDGGEPELTVVGVHGFALSRRCFHFQRRDLAKLRLPRVRQVYYDHRGHGLSGAASAENSTIEQLARDLDVVLRSLVPTGPIVLVGHSMGGMVIMELAAEFPQLFADRVAGVAFIATAAGEVGARGLPRSLLSKYNPLTRAAGGLAGWQPGLVEFVRAAGGQLTRQAVRRLAFGSRDVAPRLVDFMLEMLEVTPVRGLVNFVDTLGSHNRYAALAGLKTAEVLVLGGDSDRFTPFAHAERIASELPDAELVRVRGAGHMVLLEQPDLVTSHLIDLLQRCSGVDGEDSARRNWWWQR